MARYLKRAVWKVGGGNRISAPAGCAALGRFQSGLRLGKKTASAVNVSGSVTATALKTLVCMNNDLVIRGMLTLANRLHPGKKT
ncbi:hypothetical protein KUV26_07100 [Leisingera daeponensis]|uniref:Uncharacterized protein n=1 Tax=Leisingera daeponensis TaxID=405746 RepID=A0ABS7NDB5_9RHOB|nr:hypothetical protein [Leisingera daeponensis]MBY6139204.1 hypothetical protein [Leisingera daeponensis]